MHIAVCDDCLETQQQTVELLHRYCTQKSLAHDITTYESGSPLMYDIDDGCMFDILFLAISKSVDCGISLARQLRDAAYAGAIVFLSNSADFAYDSYAVNASGYLLKPTTMDKIRNVMTNIREELERDMYQIHKRGQVVRIPYQHIVYIESDNSRCTLHHADGSCYTIYKPLTTIQKELNDDRFLRCHQSFLVNMHHVKSIQSHFEMSNGDIVWIRQRQLKQIRDTFLNYISPYDRA